MPLRLQHMVQRIAILFLLISGMGCLCQGVNAQTSGNCGASGNNVAWSLNLIDSVLTISGIGAMEDWNFAPWSSNRLAIKTVVINSGVTNIGNNAFANCENLQSVTIPESVTTIGVNAFYRCFKLKSITIPQSVISLGLFALNSCNALTDIYVSWTNSIPNRPMNFTSTMKPKNGRKIPT